MSNNISEFNMAVGGVPGGATQRAVPSDVNTVNSVNNKRGQNAIKEFILRSVVSNKNDFCCACCTETSGIIDEKPGSILIITRDATGISERYTGCKYTPIQNRIAFNMDSVKYAIFVVNDVSPVFSMEFVDETLATMRYTHQGLPVMSEELFVLAAIYTRNKSPAIYKKFILPQRPDETIARYVSNRCGINREAVCWSQDSESTR